MPSRSELVVDDRAFGPATRSTLSRTRGSLAQLPRPLGAGCRLIVRSSEGADSSGTSRIQSMACRGSRRLARRQRAAPAFACWAFDVARDRRSDVEEFDQSSSSLVCGVVEHCFDVGDVVADRPLPTWPDTVDPILVSVDHSLTVVGSVEFVKDRRLLFGVERVEPPHGCDQGIQPARRFVETRKVDDVEAEGGFVVEADDRSDGGVDHVAAVPVAVNVQGGLEGVGDLLHSASLARGRSSGLERRSVAVCGVVRTQNRARESGRQHLGR